MLKRVESWPSVAWVLATDRRRAAAAVLGALLLLGLVFLLLGRAAHFHDLVDAASQADKAWFPICLAGEVLAYLGYAVAYRDAARADGGPVLALWSVVRVVVIGFGAFFVGSAVGGLAVDYWALREAGASGREATRRVLALNTVEWGVLAAMACVCGAIAAAAGGEGAPPAMAIAWLAVLPLCVAAALWTTQPGRVERFTRAPAPVEAETRQTHASRMVRIAFADAIGGVVLVRHIVFHGARYPGAILGFAAYWGGNLLTLYAALRAFGVHPGPVALTLAFATSYVATAIPLPAGGAGGVDAALVLTLTAVGIPLAPAVLGVLVYRGFSFWLPVIPALAFLPTVPTLQRDIEQADREPRATTFPPPRVEEGRAA